MAVLRELLVCGCRPTDVALLRRCTQRGGTQIRAVGSPVELARLALGSRPGALIFGLRRDGLDHLEVIPIVHQVWPDVPVIIVAYEDSLDLERRARQAGIFYYSLHPLDADELAAVLDDLERRAQHRRGLG
jgi:DNA-binding NtrC family response regulator